MKALAEVTGTRIMKIVGSRAKFPASPAEAVRRAERLIAEAQRIAPMPKPRGFAIKFQTREDYEHWRNAQTNPRLW